MRITSLMVFSSLVTSLAIADERPAADICLLYCPPVTECARVIDEGTCTCKCSLVGDDYDFAASRKAAEEAGGKLTLPGVTDAGLAPTAELRDPATGESLRAEIERAQKQREFDERMNEIMLRLLEARFNRQ